MVGHCCRQRAPDPGRWQWPSWSWPCRSSFSSASSGGRPGTAAGERNEDVHPPARARPDQPTLDENLTVTARVRSLADDESDYFVTDTRLYEEPDDEGDVLASNTSSELLAPGGRVEKSVETDFNAAGLQNLSIRVRLRTTDDRPITIVRPVPVRVRESHPAVALQPNRVTRAGETRLNLRVANGVNESIRFLGLGLRGGDLPVEEPERVRSVHPAGQTATVRFKGSADTVGATELDVRLS